MNYITLRTVTDADYDDYYQIRCSPSDIYWNGYTEPPEKESFRVLFQNRTGTASFSKPGDCRIFLVDIINSATDKNDTIGFVLIRVFDDDVELGYTIVEEYQNRGYATSALKLGIDVAMRFEKPLFLCIRDDNIASIKVAEKNGFSATDEYEIKEYPGAGFVKFRRYNFNS